MDATIATHVWTQFNGATAKGPVLISRQFVPRYRAYCDVVEFTVPNHSKYNTNIDGWIIELENVNMVIARVRMTRIFDDGPWCGQVVPYDDDLPCAQVCVSLQANGTADTGFGIWKSSVESIDGILFLKTTVTPCDGTYVEKCSEVEHFNQFIARAQICKKIVASTSGGDLVTGDDIWSCDFERVDNLHWRRTVVKVLAWVDEETEIDNFDRYIDLMHQHRYVLESTTSPLEPIRTVDVWESRVEEIDRVNHKMHTVLTVLHHTPRETVEWDGNLMRFVHVTRELTQEEPVESVTLDAGNAIIVEREALRERWWMKTTTTFDASMLTFYSAETFYWPAVLVGGTLELAGVTAIDAYGNEYLGKIVQDYRIKEAYNGPCPCVTQVAWLDSTDATVLNGTQAMHPTSIRYEGIVANVGLPDCLHEEIEIEEEILGYNPALTPQIRSKLYEASKIYTHGTGLADCTDWPDTLTVVTANPYKGGHVVMTRIYSKPY